MKAREASPLSAGRLISRLTTGVVAGCSPSDIEVAAGGLLVTYDAGELKLTLLIDGEYDVVFHSAKLLRGGEEKTLHSSGEITPNLRIGSEMYYVAMEEFQDALLGIGGSSFCLA